MKQVLKSTMLILVLVGASPVIAKEQTVTLAIDNMNCEFCPTTVRLAISKVTGVKSVEVDFEAAEAVVVYNDEETGWEEAAEASTNAGYRAVLKSDSVQ